MYARDRINLYTHAQTNEYPYTCTFTNTQQSGSITVVKNTVGGNGAFTFVSNFGLTGLTTSGGTASQTFSGLTPGVVAAALRGAPVGGTLIR